MSNEPQTPTKEIKTQNGYKVTIKEWLTEFEEEKIDDAYNKHLQEIKSKNITEGTIGEGKSRKDMKDTKTKSEQEYSVGLIKTAFRAAQNECRNLMLVKVEGFKKGSLKTAEGEEIDPETLDAKTAFAYMPPQDREEIKKIINEVLERIIYEKKD